MVRTRLLSYDKTYLSKEINKQKGGVRQDMYTNCAESPNSNGRMYDANKLYISKIILYWHEKILQTA